MGIVNCEVVNKQAKLELDVTKLSDAVSKKAANALQKGKEGAEAHAIARGNTPTASRAPTPTPSPTANAIQQTPKAGNIATPKAEPTPKQKLIREYNQIATAYNKANAAFASKQSEVQSYGAKLKELEENGVPAHSPQSRAVRDLFNEEFQALKSLDTECTNLKASKDGLQKQLSKLGVKF